MKKISVRIQAFVIIFILISFANYELKAQQISINRIDQMPDFPSPYLMRNWEEVTHGYDSFVFDIDASGQYLPLIFFRYNTVNYPGDVSFGLHTVVGTTSPESGEAINVIPAVVGAALTGIDKSNQNGYDWVRMCREYFNNRPEENVYLNHPVSESGDDWWYATMPNVFFYQLYDLYPETDDFYYQLRSVASQWLTAVETMGGSATPWNVPFMDYRGWYLSTMTPYEGGVKEPEAAGAIAWLLYNAYKETGDVNFRIGAEWAMEFLNDYPTNPAYELQLVYGTYIAAKMNAELGTEYDIEKMINWCFDVGPLRNWGAIVGTWGGLDVSGLIGEVNGSNDYAFSMNTFEQAGALLPLLRYDDRFANALGKWTLNAANAARYFYTEYLPANKQDSEEWAYQYDPNSLIAHEALKQLKFGVSPYATGDAIDGGWGNTNLTLYSSSHVGIFGSIIDTTEIEGILKLNLLITDFFRDDAYPTYLIYNPYDIPQTISFDAGSNNSDIYETTTNNFLMTSVTGIVQLSIPAVSSYIVVITPAGGIATYDYNKLLINDVVVDYSSGQTVDNFPPRIKSLASIQYEVLRNDSAFIFCTAVDKDGDNLQYNWASDAGVITGEGASIIWKAPSDTGSFTIIVEVSDGNGTTDFEQLIINVIEYYNEAPVINNLEAEPRKVDLGGTSEIICIASDEDGDEITYEWSCTNGIITGSGTNINWTAPVEEGNYFIKCKVTDPTGESDTDSIAVAVRDFSDTQSGNLILFLPFDGNAQDESGNNNSITVNGAILTTDRFDEVQKAYKFDGINDNMRIVNSSLLNFSNSITLNFWIYIQEFYDREQYPISHGSWENRWKVSISNDRIRWTINTSGGITDLDSETILEKNNWYNVTGYYSGLDLELYINGKLDAFKYWNGDINFSPVDLTLGQTVPGNNQYNFNGKIDDLRLFDYALSYQEIIQFYDLETSIKNDDEIIPVNNLLYQNYPNPFNSQTSINFRVKDYSFVNIDIFNVLGQKVVTLIQEEKAPGFYSTIWNGKNSSGIKVNSGIYFVRMKAGNFISVIKTALLN